MTGHIYKNIWCCLSFPHFPAEKRSDCDRQKRFILQTFVLSEFVTNNENSNFNFFRM